MKEIDIDTGIEIVGFNKKEVKKLIKKGKKFKLNVTTVIQRDMLYITVKVKKKSLNLTIYCTGLDDDDGSQNLEFSCDKSVKELESLLVDLLYRMYS